MSASALVAIGHVPEASHAISVRSHRVAPAALLHTEPTSNVTDRDLRELVGEVLGATGLKTMDAIHLASAAAAHADVLITTDKNILNVVAHEGVTIVRPEWPGDVGMV